MAEEPQIYKGLQGVVIDETKLSMVNGEEGKLIYSGYKIEDLAANAHFEEVVHLLWKHRLPNQDEFEKLRAEFAEAADIPNPVMGQLLEYPLDANPMAVLRTAVSLLALYDPDSEDYSLAANWRKATRMTAQITTVCAAWPRIRQGLKPIAPRKDLTLAQNFVYMLTGEEPDEAASSAINAYMVLLADHGMNASTFSSRVTVSTGADLHSAVVSAIGTLKGPAHGGANTEAMKMFLEIGEPENVEHWFKEEVKSKGRRIMGIGHRVYKAPDPRAAVLHDRAEELAKASGNEKWYKIALKLAEVAGQDPYFVERKLFPNVDYYSAIVLYTLKIDYDMFTPLFAMSRIAGWTAHLIEQLDDNRLMRPKAKYVGPKDLEWVPLNKR